MSKYARRIDKNQTEIVANLRDLGFSVGHTHAVGRGFPDISVGFMNLNLLVEIKSTGGTLTNDEEKFIETYKGEVKIAFSTLDVIEGFLEYVCKLDGLREPSLQQIRLREILDKFK